MRIPRTSRSYNIYNMVILWMKKYGIDISKNGNLIEDKYSDILSYTSHVVIEGKKEGVGFVKCIIIIEKYGTDETLKKNDYTGIMADAIKNGKPNRIYIFTKDIKVDFESMVSGIDIRNIPHGYVISGDVFAHVNNRGDFRVLSDKEIKTALMGINPKMLPPIDGITKFWTGLEAGSVISKVNDDGDIGIYYVA